MSKKSDDEEGLSSEDSRMQALQEKVVSSFAECTSKELEELYLYYKSSRRDMRGLIGQSGFNQTEVKQEIYDSYVEQAYLLSVAANSPDHKEAQTFFTKYAKEFSDLEGRRQIFLQMYKKDIEPDEELEAAYEERQRLAKEAAQQKKTEVGQVIGSADKRPEHVAIDMPDSSRSVPPPVVLRRSDAASVAASRRDDDERTMYSARSSQSEVSPRVFGGARTPTASSRSGAESVDGEEDGSERLSASALSARDATRQLPDAKTARSSDTVSEWVSQVDGSHHDDPSVMHRHDPRQAGREDDLESSHEGSVAEHRHANAEEIYGEVRVFSVPGGKKGYLDHVIEEHFDGIQQQHLKLSQSEYSNFVGAVDQKMAEDLQKGVLKNIEPEPVTPQISEYNIKGHILKEIEQADGTIDFKPEPGLSGVVRVQRRDKSSGMLIDAYDTIEYQEGKVSRLIVGGEGVSRLGDIGLPKERGVLVAGEMSLEEQARFASMGTGLAREDEHKRVIPPIPMLNLSGVRPIDADALSSERVSPAPTPRGPVRVLRPGGHAPGGRK